jgi:hypothetical protein
MALALLVGFGSAYWVLKGEYPVGSGARRAMDHLA